MMFRIAKNILSQNKLRYFSTNANNYFKDKVVVISGGSDGIGLACVNKFLSIGAKVVSLDIIKRISIKPFNYVPFNFIQIKCDMKNDNDIKKSVDLTIKNFKKIDCVVNNAGVHPPVTSTENFTVDQFKDTLNMNLVSAFALSKYSSEHLKKSQGSIINISSMVGIVGQYDSVAYCASKLGMDGLTKAMALDLAKYNVRVNGVAPSNVLTTSMKNWLNTFEKPEEAKKRVTEIQKLNRMATPEEIANIVYFLANPELSSFITGQIIQADGGASLGSTS